MLIGHKYRIYPDEFQSEVLKLWIGHQRFIYNSKVHEQNYWYTFYKKSLSLTGTSYSPDQSYSQFRNPELTPWLDLAPPEILRNGCYRYMSGYHRFRKSLANVPTVKSKYGKQSVLVTSELFYFHDSNINNNDDDESDNENILNTEIQSNNIQNINKSKIAKINKNYKAKQLDKANKKLKNKFNRELNKSNKYKNFDNIKNNNDISSVKFDKDKIKDIPNVNEKVKNKFNKIKVKSKANLNKNHTIFIGNDKFIVGNIKFKVNKNNRSINNNTTNKSYAYTKPKSITISLEPSGQWFISFNSEEVVNKNEDKNLTPNIESKNNINKNIESNIIRTEEELLYEYSIKSNKEDFVNGIDRGVKIPAATSSSKTYCLDEINMKRIAKKEIKIKRYQRKLARQKEKAKLNGNGFKISNNQVKTKKKIGKLKSYGNNTNNDFSHKTSRDLINDEKTLVYVLEDLKVANMTKSPKLKLANKNLNSENNNLSNQNINTNSKPKYLPNGAAAKAGLNKAILNSNMGRIKQQLQYKAVKANKLVLFVNPMFSSQECSQCHHIDSNNRLNQSEFKCINCGYTDNADVNASKVIQYRGIQKLNKINEEILNNTYKYKPKSKKTVNFKKNKDKNLSNSKVTVKNNTVGQGLPDFKPDENLSVTVNSNDLSVLNSRTQETQTNFSCG